MNGSEGLNFYKKGRLCPKCKNIISPDLAFCPLCYVPIIYNDKFNYEEYEIIESLIKKEDDDVSRT